MSRQGQREEVLLIADRASHWLETLGESPDPRTRADFAAWLAESPAHVREFLNIVAIDRALCTVDPDKRTPVVRQDRNASNVHPLPGRAPGASNLSAPSRSRSRKPVMVAATLLLSLGSGALLWNQAGGWQEYTTVVGEQSTIKLADGSVISLNTKSRVRVRLTDSQRQLRLVEGEALFAVEPDAERPLTVRTRDANIQVLGTKFNVYSRRRDTTISVLEGSVKVVPRSPVETPVLAAGEQLSVTTTGELVTPEVQDVAVAVAWRDRRLVFRADTLEDIAAEFNRYNAALKVRIEDEDLRERRFTGVLDADKPQSLTRILTREGDILLERRNTEIVIRRAPQTGTSLSGRS